MSFIYGALLKLLYPTSIMLVLVVAGMALRRRARARRVCFAAALFALLAGGNGWLVSGMTRRLEGQFLSPDPMPQADAIVVLSGGVHGKTPPRPSVEIGDAGDRLLYGAALYRQGKAPEIICTGNVATGGVAARPAAEDMAELLQLIGVPSSAIASEIESENTHDHAVNLCPVFQQRQIRRVLLVTSALHMPRSVGVFRRACPTVEFVPAPTDFRAPYERPVAWYRGSLSLLPTPRSLLDFSDAAHEYVGIAYYKLRGWL
jgi:uncharacterized SAM-binding protein YcdF (DUF218 family)